MEKKNNSKKGVKKGNTTSKNVSKKTSTKKTTTNNKVAKTTTPVVKKVAVEEKPVKALKVKKENCFKRFFRSIGRGIKSNCNKMYTKCSNDNSFFIVVIICVILVLLLILAVVYGRVPKTSDGKDIIVSVNGKTITADDLYTDLKTTYGSNTAINMIDAFIASKEVKSKSDLKEISDYAAEVVDYYKDYADQYGVTFEEFLKTYVGISDVTTEEEFKNYVMKDYKKSIAVRNYLAENYSDKDVKSYYDDNYSKSLTIRQILIEVEDDKDDEAKAKAQSLISQLKEVKDDNDKLVKKFEQLAYDNSDDSKTYSNGGLVENFAKNDVDESIWTAANKLKDGSYTTEPVKGTNGYYVILRVSSNKGKALKEIESEVRTAMAKEELENNSNLSITAWDKLRKKYNLKINDKKVKSIYDETISNYNK